MLQYTIRNSIAHYATTGNFVFFQQINKVFIVIFAKVVLM